MKNILRQRPEENVQAGRGGAMTYRDSYSSAGDPFRVGTLSSLCGSAEATPSSVGLSVYCLMTTNPQKEGGGIHSGTVVAFCADPKVRFLTQLACVYTEHMHPHPKQKSVF